MEAIKVGTWNVTGTRLLHMWGLPPFNSESPFSQIFAETNEHAVDVLAFISPVVFLVIERIVRLAKDVNARVGGLHGVGIGPSPTTKSDIHVIPIVPGGAQAGTSQRKVTGHFPLRPPAGMWMLRLR